MQNSYMLPLNRKISTLEQYSQTNLAYSNLLPKNSKDLLFKSDFRITSTDSKNLIFEDNKSKMYKVGTFGRIEEINCKQNEFKDFHDRRIQNDLTISKPEESAHKKFAQLHAMPYLQPKTKRHTLLKPKKPPLQQTSILKDSQLPIVFEPQSKVQLESKKIEYKNSFYKKDALLSSETNTWFRALKPSAQLQISPIKSPATPYDENGCLRETGQDICDCFNPHCQGCWWLCPSCQKSRKCGFSCRCNRNVIPDDLLNKIMFKPGKHQDFDNKHTDEEDRTYFF